jgi:hypothetical protein
MQFHRLTIPLKKKDDSIHLRPLGDIHLFNKACDVEKLMKNINIILTRPNHYTLGMGDYVDGVVIQRGSTHLDKRFDPDIIDRSGLTMAEQTMKLVDIWRPIVSRTWGMLMGNHEWKYMGKTEFQRDVTRELGVKYLGRMAYIHVTFTWKNRPLRSYLILALHGGYSGLQAGGAVNRLKQIAADFDADLVLMGHSHDTITRTGIKTTYDPKSNKAVERKVVQCITGTFLSSYAKDLDTYVEVNPREAKRVGTITATFTPYTGDLHAHD